MTAEILQISAVIYLFFRKIGRNKLDRIDNDPGAFSSKEKAGKKMYALFFDEIFQVPLRPKKLGSSFFFKREKEPKKNQRKSDVLTLVTHLLDKVIDRRDGKVKGRQQLRFVIHECISLRHFVFGHFLPYPETDIHP